jgi:hypothetical protein
MSAYCGGAEDMIEISRISQAGTSSLEMEESARLYFRKRNTC